MEVAVASSSGDGERPSLLNLPSGFHFAPTNEELIVDYLRPRMEGYSPRLPIFIDKADVVGKGPEELTAKYRDCGEDKRWYFFTKRERKYNSGNRPNRTTKDGGCWKATGPPKLIFSGKKEQRRLVGRRKTLVFYLAPPVERDPLTGLPLPGKKRKAQSDDKTNWTMFEYENLKSEEEAADHTVDKLDEWVLCTIQQQKKEDSGAGEKKVKEIKGKTKTASKKRKVKEEKTENITGQAQIQVLQVTRRAKAPMLPAHQEGGYGTGMFDYYGSCPMKSSPVLTRQPYESPITDTMSPCFIDNDQHYSPNYMAPTVLEPPRSEMMPTTSAGGNHNTSSAGSDDMTCFQGLPDILHLPYSTRNTPSFSPTIVPMTVRQEPPHPHTGMEYEPSSFAGYSYNNSAPNMVRYPPATNYNNPLSVAGFGANTGFMAMLMNSGPMNSQSLVGGSFAGSSQYHGLGQGMPLAQDQVTMRI